MCIEIVLEPGIESLRFYTVYVTTNDVYVNNKGLLHCLQVAQLLGWGWVSPGILVNKHFKMSVLETSLCKPHFKQIQLYCYRIFYKCFVFVSVMLLIRLAEEGRSMRRLVMWAREGQKLTFGACAFVMCLPFQFLKYALILISVYPNPLCKKLTNEQY